MAHIDRPMGQSDRCSPRRTARRPNDLGVDPAVRTVRPAALSDGAGTGNRPCVRASSPMCMDALSATDPMA